MNRRGMTLVEMMVAVTATLILMGAIAQMFSVFGTAVSRSRAALDLDSQMRIASWRLRSDLGSLTARTTPPLNPDAGEGYLEIIEGPCTDRLMYFYYDAASGAMTPVSTSPTPFDTAAATSPGPSAGSDDRLIGDCDDVLLFTARNATTPFIGRGPNGTFESTTAEIAWFARPTPGTSNPTTYTLYRKQLLVMGHVAAAPFATNNRALFTSWSDYYDQPCDISARVEVIGGVPTLLPNTLTDLTKREARFLHKWTPNPSGTFPYYFVPHQASLTADLDGLFFGTAARRGEDVVLTDVVAFDVRVFDPATPIATSSSGNTGLVPGDSGVSAPMTATASGAYVDLGNQYSGNSLLPAALAPRFASWGYGTIQALAATDRRIYDTWTTHYESNGIDDDSDGYTDEGANGIDDDGDSEVDEWDEQEGPAPYPYPLRGIEVRIRCYERATKQVRQVTIRQTFVPH